MSWSRDQKPEKFDKAKMEREIAEIQANKWCAELLQQLDTKAEALRQDPNDSIKKEELKKLVIKCKDWMNYGPNKFAKDGGYLKSKAIKTEQEFSFTEEKK